jgi:hypothetical protein
VERGDWKVTPLARGRGARDGWISGGPAAGCEGGVSKKPPRGWKDRRREREAVSTCAVKGVRFKFIVVLV